MSIVLWILLGVAVVIAAAIGLQLPEIKRYLKMRAM